MKPALTLEQLELCGIYIYIYIYICTYYAIYALTISAVTVHVQSVTSRDCSLLTWCVPQYTANCATQCMQSGKHKKTLKTSKTYVNVYSTKIIHVLMHAVLEQKHIVQDTLMHHRSPCGKVWAPQDTVAVLARE